MTFRFLNCWWRWNKIKGPCNAQGKIGQARKCRNSGMRVLD